MRILVTFLLWLSANGPQLNAQDAPPSSLPSEGAERPTPESRAPKPQVQVAPVAALEKRGLQRSIVQRCQECSKKYGENQTVYRLACGDILSKVPEQECPELDISRSRHNPMWKSP